MTKPTRAFILAIALAACSSTTTRHVVTGRPTAASNADVAIYMLGVDAPAGFEEVAIVQAIGRGGHADLNHVIEGLKVEAAKLGCNAIINVRIDQGSNAASGTAVAGRIVPTNVPPSAH